MDLKSTNDVILFILFFIPGFIMMQVYNLHIAREKIDFSKGLLEAVTFSCINYALCSPLIIWILSNNIATSCTEWFLLLTFVILFILPIFFVKLYLKIIKSKWALKNSIIDVNKSAWDSHFSKRKVYWVVVTLKDGKKIGGCYKEESFAASYPSKDIYISELWKLKPDGSFDKKVDRTCGILIMEEELQTIEFLN